MTEDRLNLDALDVPKINLGYAVYQIAKAITTGQEHDNPETRERALKKAQKWIQVINGMGSGSINVGSRTPVADTPGWATLEVVTGGFATGALMAGGPLQEHEVELLARVAPGAPNEDRTPLNTYYLSEEGYEELLRMLDSGCFDIRVPEEGALLVIAWLVSNGQNESAHALLCDIAPFFSRLRFYPVPVDSPKRFGTKVHLQDVDKTRQDLSKIGPNERILAQKEAIEIWAPLYDRAISLLLETVDGDPPTLATDTNDKPVRTDSGSYTISGGWPCKNYPGDWIKRAKALLREYRTARKSNRRSGKPERKKDSFWQVRSFIEQCAKDPSSLSGKDVGRIRLLLARYITKRGVPDSDTCRARRRAQEAIVAAPTHHAIADLVSTRLGEYPGANGVDDVDPFTLSVTDDESIKWAVPAETPIPESIERKVQRCLSDTIDALVERGIITSGDTMARVLPQMTSGLRAMGIEDPQLRQLYSSIYRAFRLRRSLLLLNLESQVKIEELPWISAIERFRRSDLSAVEVAKQTLAEVLVLTLTSFPQAILPNKLLQELRALCKSAKLELPWVDEVAADIFMGQFSGKFTVAAQKAAELLRGTLYQRYYQIDTGKILSFPVPGIEEKRGFFGRTRKVTSNALAELCAKRAKTKLGGWGNVVGNGMTIEQEQILTTHNLAIVFGDLGLRDQLQPHLESMAKECFAWVCSRLQVKADKFHAKLIAVKNSAYAWRQMVFFLSFLPEDRVAAFLIWSTDHFAEQPIEFRERFAPAMDGLKQAVEGTAPKVPFLGWSSNHWLLS